MTAIKSTSASSDKWVRRSSVAGPDYQSGINNPRRDWAEAASAANDNYRQAVTQAAQQGRFAQGVKNAGSDRWRDRSLAKGPSRFSEGVSLAQDDWERGFAPYAETISRLNLPARGPKGSPQNLQRVQAVSQALRQQFERTLGGRSSS